MQPNATLTPKQTRAATLEAMGHTTDEIAATMGVHRATVFRWRKCKVYRGLVASTIEAGNRLARRQLEAASLDATARLVALLDSGDDRVRLRAALAILDRTGHGPAQRIELQARAKVRVDREDATEELARLLSGMDAAAK